MTQDQAMEIAQGLLSKQMTEETIGSYNAIRKFIDPEFVGDIDEAFIASAPPEMFIYVMENLGS